MARTLHWGLPTTPALAHLGAQVLEVKLSDDATVGGGTNCGSDDWPGYYETWGRNEDGPSATAPRVQMGLSAQVNARQNQNDIADWPCYARYFAAWSLAELPAGAQVVSATVEMRQFGNPGYGANYTVDGPQDTRYEVFEVADAWNEAGITWDNAPSPRENVAWTVVRAIPDWCNGFCNPGIPYQFDVTEIVKRAQKAGRSWASMALYKAAATITAANTSGLRARGRARRAHRLHAGGHTDMDRNGYTCPAYGKRPLPQHLLRLRLPQHLHRLHHGHQRRRLPPR